jgi:hypothetical protein
MTTMQSEVRSSVFIPQDSTKNLAPS